MENNSDIEKVLVVYWIKNEKKQVAKLICYKKDNERCKKYFFSEDNIFVNIDTQIEGHYVYQEDICLIKSEAIWLTGFDDKEIFEAVKKSEKEIDLFESIPFYLLSKEADFYTEEEITNLLKKFQISDEDI